MRHSYFSLCRAILLLGAFGAAVSASARATTEAYRGRVIREEVVRTDPIVEKLNARFVGFDDGSLAFAVTRTTRTVKWLRAYHEKILLTRNTDDPADSGFKELVPGEEITGDLRSVVNEEDLGPIRGAVFRLPDGREMVTNKDGILSDPRQSLIRSFDALRPSDLVVKLTGEEGALQLQLSRNDFWKRAGSAERLETTIQAPRPGQIEISSTWDRPSYRAGDRARLTLTVTNRASKGSPIGFVKGGRAMSRHSWLEGPVFYVEPVPPGQSRSFTREFLIPKDFDLEVAHMRVGFNEYSGTKPQHTVLLKVRK